MQQHAFAAESDVLVASSRTDPGALLVQEKRILDIFLGKMSSPSPGT